MGNLTLDRSRYQAYSEGKPLDLEPREFDILWLLAEKAGRTFKENELFNELKKVHPKLEKNPFRKYIHQLRYKLNRKFIQIIDENRYRMAY